MSPMFSQARPGVSLVSTLAPDYDRLAVICIAFCHTMFYIYTAKVGVKGFRHAAYCCGPTGPTGPTGSADVPCKD